MADTLATPAGGREDAHLIRVRGARVHNLRNVDVDIPRDRLVVLTGVSGSGKSSLAFDTLHAEAQRRYIEGLSSYARQFLDQLERPDVDSIEGLPPTVSIDQSSGTVNPRSTVATVTEVHDYLRVLYARTGLPHCPNCGQPIRRQTPEQMVASVLAMQQGRKVLILAPLVRGRKGQHLDTFETIRRAGLIRVRVDGQVVELGEPPPKLSKTKTHDIEAVVDRIVIRDGIRPRLAEGIDLALKLSDGTVLLSVQEGEAWHDHALSIRYACPACGTGIVELEPRTFSFNSPHGACQTCDGLGTLAAFDPELVIGDRDKSLESGAVAAWQALAPGTRDARLHDPSLSAFLKRHRVTPSTTLSSWPPRTLERLLHGEPGHAFPGLLAELERDYQNAKSEARKAALGSFRNRTNCPDCHGTRLRPEARAVTVGGRSISDVCNLPITDAIRFFQDLRFPSDREQVGPPLAREISNRLGFLEQVGLGYLTLARGADTLSGGELQRVRLASQIGSGLVGVCYVLDEPTAGLHPSDTERLLSSLESLRDQGNTVVVVEHDEATIRAADWLVDLGPGAGTEGGMLVAQGPPEAPVAIGPSSTLRYLHATDRASLGEGRRLSESPGWLRIVGASERNLKSIDVQIPFGCLTCVTGVSGSGKSTLVLEVLARAVRRALTRSGPRPGAVVRIDGLDMLGQLVEVDQAPIGRGPRSTPATYTGVLDEIRRVFARTRDAKLRGYGTSRFSFNVKGGRCEVCEGQGVRKLEMNFLPDLYIPCEACRGKRFNRQTLEITFKGHSIGDVLDLRVEEALALFDAQPMVRKGLSALHEAGLGYITLGQSSATLSGGEAQRVKLAAELGRASPERTLYILDEPTTGLHFEDVDRLLRMFHRLVDQGSTIVVIEHNVEVIRHADWVVDLGPAGGYAGGQVVASGTPRQVAENPSSATGRFLREPG